MTRRAVTGRLALPLALVALAVSAGCGSSSKSGARPTTPARLTIIAPTPNAVVGPDFTLEFRVDGGRVVKRTSGKLTSDEGHIHVTLDGKLIQMLNSTTFDLHNQPAGRHTLQAEFVAVDHAPFVNRASVTRSVFFEVRPA
jgi:hypothetical protein